MRHWALTAALISMSAIASAQTTQSVQVVEYNGKEAKTPMQGVGLTVTNAGAAMSDAQGMLTLTFRTLHPGDPISIKRIEKSGYEIFNIDAVEQWTISPQQQFQLIICRSDRFRALCDQYNQVASQSYAQQLQKDKNRLAAEREAGKLKEAEYEQKLQEVTDMYEEQLENLDLYVEKFARFDLSALSEAEQAIIELVQQGKIEDAIARYEEMDLLGQYKAQSNDIQQISSAQDSLSVIREEKVAARDSIGQIINMMEDVKNKRNE